ncbi:MAG TPA: hypothetical protein VHZ26_07070 [Caulobacteraceae bacterium]|jgi:hypothetical protein|nr:hypothetical protein [Caulobacteraceae bacterium]
MRRRLLIAILAAWAFAAPAFADDMAPDIDRAVTLSPVAIPIIVDGQVVNYIFVTARVLLTPQADQFALRDKEPFFRDALVRAAYRTPFLLKTDYNHIDEARLKAALWRDAAAIAGPGKVSGIQVVSQTPQHFIRPPQTPTH